MIQNQLVQLRALEPEDIDKLYIWENDPNVWHVGQTNAPFSRFLLSKYIDSNENDIYTTPVRDVAKLF